MKPNRRLSLAAGIITVVVAAVFIAFAPAQLGGQANYIVVNGGSMEPGLHKGDLAIVRGSDTYQVGDVATYRHPEIGHVIHRIIGKDETGRFILQGDNNDYIDPYHPAQSEMVGELWIHIPKVGSWLSHLREPRNAAIVVFFALVGLGGGGARATQVQTTWRRRRRGPAPQAAAAGRTTMNRITKNWQDLATVLGVAVAGFGLLGLVAFNRPVERTVPQDLAYRQAGAFTYTASAPEGTVYDTGQATPGEPVFRALSDGFTASFEYTFESEHRHAVHGSYRFVAEVGDETGWRRTMELVPETPFEGDTFTATATVDVNRAQELIDILNSTTGVSAREYTLTLRPEVTVSGTIDGEPLAAEFAPALAMELDELQVRLPSSSNLEDDPLRPLAEGVAPHEGGEPNTISLLMYEMAVGSARFWSVAGLGLSLALAGALIVSMLRDGGASASGTAVAATRARLTGVVTIRGGLPPARGRLVDVATLDDLARLAETTGGPVLQEVRPGYHCFYLCDVDITYRYHAAGPRPAPAQRPEGHVA